MYVCGRYVAVQSTSLRDRAVRTMCNKIISQHTMARMEYLEMEPNNRTTESIHTHIAKIAEIVDGGGCSSSQTIQSMQTDKQQPQKHRITNLRKLFAIILSRTHTHIHPFSSINLPYGFCEARPVAVHHCLHDGRKHGDGERGRAEQPSEMRENETR